MLKYDLNLREYWRIIKRRRFIILFTCIIMGVFSLVSAILNKPVPIYRTSAAVKVEKTQSLMGFGAPSYGSANLETQTIMIRSYYILELTAKKMGLIPDNLSSEDIRNNPKYIGVILDLKDKVRAEQEGGSDLINIEVTANDGKFAARFANDLAEVYQRQHTLDLNRRTIEGKRFVEGQFAAAREKMVKSEEAIKKFREDNKWTSVDSESTYTLNEVKRLRSQYSQDQIVLQKLLIAERSLSGAEDQPLTSRISFYFEEASPPYKALNDKLVGYMTDRDTLLLTYTDNFPQIQAIRSQINDTVARMRVQLNLQKNSLADNQQILRRQIAALEEQFKRLPEKGLELAKLEREMAINREIYTLLEKKYHEILIAEAEKLEEVKIVKPALEPGGPINPPKIGNNAAIGTLMGLILGVVFAFLIETFDTSIGAIEEVEEFLGVHVLGVIPFVSPEEVRLLLSDDQGRLTVEESKLPRYTRMASHFVPTSTLAESYKAFRTSLNFACMENHYKTLALTSSSPSEGKTSTIVNLALTMAQTGHKVLLIDGDLRRPVIAGLFGIEQAPGLTDVIMGNYEWRNVVRNISDFMMGQMSVEEVMLTPGLDNLNIITSGVHTPNPAEIIGSKGIAEFMRQVRAEYDMVLVDAPPVLSATDAALWSSQVDATVLVYQVGKIARGALKRAKMQLDAIKTNIVGVVLNGIRAEISADFTYHDYYYHYRYGDDRGKKRPWYKPILEKLGFDRIMNYGFAHKKGNQQRRTRKGSGMKNGSGSATAASVSGAQGAETWARLSSAAPLPPDEKNGTVEEAKAGGGWKRFLPLIKIVVAVLALLFLVLGILYQGGFLKAFWPGGKGAAAPKSSLRPAANYVVVAAPLPASPSSAPLAVGVREAATTLPAPTGAVREAATTLPAPTGAVKNASRETGRILTEARNLDETRREAFAAGR
ncbi:MAG: AAA family ATPase [Pseudomonadota bacterium]|nr:AAA family ATPase [Pseudomonadota bacterium]